MMKKQKKSEYEKSASERIKESHHQESEKEYSKRERKRRTDVEYVRLSIALFILSGIVKCARVFACMGAHPCI